MSESWICRDLQDSCAQKHAKIIQWYSNDGANGAKRRHQNCNTCIHLVNVDPPKTGTGMEREDSSGRQRVLQAFGGLSLSAETAIVRWKKIDSAQGLQRFHIVSHIPLSWLEDSFAGVYLAHGHSEIV